jgi:hypothetical protein
MQKTINTHGIAYRIRARFLFLKQSKGEAMQITNQKTGVSFNSRTTKQNDGFVAVATRREANSESLIHRELCKTRGAARYRAEREAYRAYMAHVRIFSM